MKRQLAAALGCAATLVTVGGAGAAGIADALGGPPIVIPYLSHGAGVYVDRCTGRPIVAPIGAPPPPRSPGVHYIGHC